MLNSKNFTIEFLTFNGIDTTCKLCNERIRDNQEEVMIPLFILIKNIRGQFALNVTKTYPQELMQADCQSLKGKE